MLLRMGMVLAFAVMLAPHEPNLGIGRPEAFAQFPALLQFRTVALNKLYQLRVEIEANRHPLSGRGV